MSSGPAKSSQAEYLLLREQLVPVDLGGDARAVGGGHTREQLRSELDGEVVPDMRQEGDELGPARRGSKGGGGRTGMVST
jgi:hypothetical protein